MKDELLDETELYPFAEDEKGVSFLVRHDGNACNSYLIRERCQRSVVRTLKSRRGQEDAWERLGESARKSGLFAITTTRATNLRPITFSQSASS